MGNLWESLGYDVFSWFPQASKICRITFSTWDFGGQSVFHNLHHLFLSRYSVYLVVFKMPHMMKDPQRAVEMIRYWLNSLALHAKGAPILLVGTHKDQVSWPMGTER
jgi:GTPase SAR1 family protein